jgi:hypothetical protein
MNRTWTLYHTAEILQDLNISLCDLKQMVILCGSDYNVQQDKATIRKLFDLYYHNYDNKTTFYEWYCSYDKNNTMITTEKMEHLCSLFDTTIHENTLRTFCDSYLINESKKMNLKTVREIMEKYGFVFL